MKIPVSRPFRIIKHVSKTWHPQYLADAYFGFIFKKLSDSSVLYFEGLLSKRSLAVHVYLIGQLRGTHVVGSQGFEAQCDLCRA